MRTYGAALVLGVLLTVGAAGCGGSDEPDRPTTSAVAEALGTLQESDSGEPVYSATQARCIAGVLTASDLSTASLRGITQDPAAFSPEGAEAEEFSRIAGKISTCLVDELTVPSAAP